MRSSGERIGGTLQADAISRYLQHLTGTRIQHMNRIYSFSIREKCSGSQVSAEAKASIMRSKSFLEVTLAEAAASHAFAQALTQVFSYPVVPYL